MDTTEWDEIEKRQKYKSISRGQADLTPTLPEKDLLTIKEVAAYLRVMERTVRKYISDGKIPEKALVRLGKTLRIRREPFLAWAKGIKNIEAAQRRGFQELLQSRNSTISIVDRNGKILFINQLKVGTRQEVVGKTIYDFVPPQYIPSLQNAVTETFQGNTTRMEVGAYLLNGEPVSFALEFVPIMEGDQVVNAGIVGIEITEVSGVRS